MMFIEFIFSVVRCNSILEQKRQARVHVKNKVVNTCYLSNEADDSQSTADDEQVVEVDGDRTS